MEQKLKTQFLYEVLNMLNAAVVVWKIAFGPGLNHTYSKYKEKQSNVVSKPKVLKENIEPSALNSTKNIIYYNFRANWIY